MSSQESRDVLEELFSNVPREKPPAELRESIMARVRAEASKPRTAIEVVGGEQKKPAESPIIAFFSQARFMRYSEVAAALLFIVLSVAIMQQRGDVISFNEPGGDPSKAAALGLSLYAEAAGGITQPDRLASNFQAQLDSLNIVDGPTVGPETSDRRDTPPERVANALGATQQKGGGRGGRQQQEAISALNSVREVANHAAQKAEQGAQLGGRGGIADDAKLNVADGDAAWRRFAQIATGSAPPPPPAGGATAINRSFLMGVQWLENYPPIDEDLIEEDDNGLINNRSVQDLAFAYLSDPAAAEKLEKALSEKPLPPEPYASILHSVSGYINRNGGKVINWQMVRPRDPNKPHYVKLTCLAPVAVSMQFREVFVPQQILLSNNKEANTGTQQFQFVDPERNGANVFSLSNPFNAKASNFRQLHPLDQAREERYAEEKSVEERRVVRGEGGAEVMTRAQARRGFAGGRGREAAEQGRLGGSGRNAAALLTEGPPATSPTVKLKVMQTTVDAVIFDIYCQPVELNAGAGQQLKDKKDNVERKQRRQFTQ